MIVRFGKRAFVKDALKEALPNVEAAVWFAKAMDFTATDRSELLYILFGESDVVRALTREGGEHSTELQDYLLEEGYEYLLNEGNVRFSTDVPKGDILPHVWESLTIQIVDSIKEVIDVVGDTIGMMPGKEGEMLIESMMKFNVRRPVFGDFLAKVKHHHQVPNLVVFDTSGSMTEETVKLIVAEVVALAYKANAHLAIVSDTATVWGPGEYDVDVVLAAAEYCGTHYETLAPLFDSDWGAVVTIADYDSSYAAKGAFASARGRVQEVFDISLVDRPTYLSEVIGTVSAKVTPLMIANDNYCCMR